MSDIVYCNKPQTERVLRKYFTIKPVITKVEKSSENGMYFITCLTVPGLNTAEFQYRPWCNNVTGKKIGACFGEVRVGDRRYDLSYCDEFPRLMITLNKACEKAIKGYENDCDIFRNEGTCIAKGFFINLFHTLTKSSKRWYIWTIIVLSVLLGLSLTSCESRDSIQNYQGSEVLSIKTYSNVKGIPYYVVKLRIKKRYKIDEGDEYRIIEITCYDAMGYVIGDTVKIKSLPR